MKASELRDLEAAELSKRVAELRKEVFGLRFANATGELDDTAGLGRAKRDLARALTVQRGEGSLRRLGIDKIAVATPFLSMSSTEIAAVQPLIPGAPLTRPPINSRTGVG